MKTFNHKYDNFEYLKEYIFENEISLHDNILIQVFTGRVDEREIKSINSELMNLLPQASIIGSTTAGEIYRGGMSEQSIVISFSIFTTTKVVSKLYDNRSEKRCAQQIIDDLVFDDTKVLIVFSDGLQSNGEEFLSEIAKIKPNLIISGGRAGDDRKFERTFVFDKDLFTENGFVVASLSGKELIVNGDYMLNWESLGLPMKITKADKNRVFEINRTPIIDIYKKYLGYEVAAALPEAATEFPFIIKRGSVDVARAPIALLEDNSLLFGGNIEVGEEVMFAFGNVDVIKEKNRDSFKKLQKFPVEAVFVYSCSVRKYLLGKDLESEIEIFETIAPTTGFFTYGEFLHSSNVNELLNITTTYLTLSESTDSIIKKIPSTSNRKESRNLRALSHLVSTTSKELIKSQDILNMTQNIVEVGSWEWDIATNEIWWSDETYTMAGVNKDDFDVTYDSFLSIIHPDDRDLVMGAVSMSVEHDIPYKVEHRLVQKSGSEIMALEQGIVKRDSDGNPTNMIGTIQNITAIKKNEKELMLLKDRAVESARSKSHFLANMSHEIRTPLNAIVGFISLLKESETDKKKLEYLNIVNESSANLLGIINDILDISKIESKKLEVESISFDIKSDMDTIYSLFSVMADEKMIQLKYFCSSNLPKYVKSDPLRIKQIVSNLLSNALKFTNKNGIVEFSVDYENEFLDIRISDNGIGIEKDKLAHIFDPFSQADLSTTRKYGGTGLGLNISQELSNLMGGELSVKSVVGEGSTFKFLLPASESEDIKVIEVDVDDIKFEGRVLVAEDNKTNQLLVSIMLDELDLEYKIVENGEEAVEVCKEEEFDLILMDINMPVMNGIEALYRIRNSDAIVEKMRSVPVLALTANAIKGDKENFLDEGMDGYIPKPIDKNEFVTELSRFLKTK